MDLEPIEERANEFATWVGKFDSTQRIPAAFASAADVPALLAEVERLRADVALLRPALAQMEEAFEEESDAHDALKAEVAMTARPAPAWDEDPEVDREALRRFVDSFCDDEAGEVEHVVSADGTSGFALTGGNDAHAVLRKAASALWPGRSEAEVKAEALWEWVEDMTGDLAATKAEGIDLGRDYLHGMRSALMQANERADRLAAEGGADRG